MSKSEDFFYVTDEQPQNRVFAKKSNKVVRKSIALTGTFLVAATGVAATISPALATALKNTVVGAAQVLANTTNPTTNTAPIANDANSTTQQPAGLTANIPAAPALPGTTAASATLPGAAVSTPSPSTSAAVPLVAPALPATPSFTNLTSATPTAGSVSGSTGSASGSWSGSHESGEREHESHERGDH